MKVENAIDNENEMGVRFEKLSRLSKRICRWANIVEADFESRWLDRNTKYSLSPQVFRKIK